MKTPIDLKQLKPPIVNVLGFFILLLTLFLLYEQTADRGQLIAMLCICSILLGYSISFEISNSLKPKRHYKFFGITVFRQRLACIGPDYILVFSARFKKESQWGPVSELGKQTRADNFVIRFFRGNSDFTVWKGPTLEAAKAKAVALGEL